MSVFYSRVAVFIKSKTGRVTIPGIIQPDYLWIKEFRLSVDKIRV